MTRPAPPNSPRTDGRTDARIRWRTGKSVKLAGRDIPVSEGVVVTIDDSAGKAQEHAGIRPRDWNRERWKAKFFPAAWTLQRLLWTGHGFVYTQIGRWVRRYLRPGGVFLEAGACDMQMRRLLPRGATYNGFDLAFSETLLRIAFEREPDINIAIASINDIPVDDASCDVVIGIEMIAQIQTIERALGELNRILKPRGKLIVSVPNGFSRKIERKGMPWFYSHRWHAEDFERLAASAGFRVAERRKAGRWLQWTVRLGLNMHLPLTSSRDELNVYFLYVLEKTGAAAPAPPSSSPSMSSS